MTETSFGVITDAPIFDVTDYEYCIEMPRASYDGLISWAKKVFPDFSGTAADAIALLLQDLEESRLMAFGGRHD